MTGMDRYASRVALLLALGGLMVVLDTTVTFVAVPQLIEQFHSSLAAVQWVTSAYTLALVTVIPTAAWMIDRCGAKRVYLGALMVFLLGSALASLAWNIESLIMFRVLQGMGGGLINPVGMTIGLRAVDPAHRGRLMSVLGLPVLVGPLAGPTLGGWLIDTLSWRWIYGVNIPVGILALVLGAQLIRADTPRPGARLDVRGLLMLSPGGALLVLGLTGLERPRGLANPTVFLPALAGAGLLVWFAQRSLAHPAALLRLELLTHRSLAAGAAALFAFGAGYFGAAVILPTYVQVVRGDSATTAGLLAIPTALATGLTLQLATRLVDTVSPRAIVVTGTLIAAGGVLATAWVLSAQTSYPLLMGVGAINGIGVGATLMPTMTTATRDLDHDELPSGTAIMSILQQLAVALGIAVVSIVMACSIDNHAPQLHGGGVAAVMALPDAARNAIAAALAHALQLTLLVPLALMLCATAAAVCLPRRRMSAPASEVRA